MRNMDSSKPFFSCCGPRSLIGLKLSFLASYAFCLLCALLRWLLC